METAVVIEPSVYTNAKLIFKRFSLKGTNEPIMKQYTKRSILFLLIAALLLVACGGAESPEDIRPIAVEQTSEETADSSEAIAVEGQPVVVTRVVTETVNVEAEEEAMEDSFAGTTADAAAPLPLATAPANGTTAEEPPLPRVQATPSAMFFEEYGVNPYILTEVDNIPSEPWVLPIALYGGMLQLPLQPTAMQDEVERLLLPGLQHRTYGAVSLVQGRRLWRDFKAAAKPDLDKPAGWAAAAEFVMSEQDVRNVTQAAIAKHYQTSLTNVVPRIKQIKKVLGIKGLDERYTDLQATQIVYKDEA